MKTLDDYTDFRQLISHLPKPDNHDQLSDGELYQRMIAELPKPDNHLNFTGSVEQWIEGGGTADSYQTYCHVIDARYSSQLAQIIKKNQA